MLGLGVKGFKGFHGSGDAPLLYYQGLGGGLGIRV